MLRANGKPSVVHFYPWLVIGSACQHPAYVLLFKQPPERRRPFSEVWKTLAEDQEIQTLFAGLLDGGLPGNVRVHLWGDQAGELRGGGAHGETAWRASPLSDHLHPGPGLSVQLGLAVHNYAQLRRYANYAFGPEVNIRIHRCTAPGWPAASSTGWSLTSYLRLCPKTSRVCCWAPRTPASLTACGSG